MKLRWTWLATAALMFGIPAAECWAQPQQQQPAPPPATSNPSTQGPARCGANLNNCGAVNHRKGRHRMAGRKHRRGAGDGTGAMQQQRNRGAGRFGAGGNGGWMRGGNGRGGRS